MSNECTEMYRLSNYLVKNFGKEIDEETHDESPVELAIRLLDRYKELLKEE